MNKVICLPPGVAFARALSSALEYVREYEAVEHKVRLQCACENDFQYVTADLPVADDGHGSRLYAMEQIRLSLEDGETIEQARHWRTASVRRHARNLARSFGEAGEAADNARRAFATLGSSTATFGRPHSRHRGRNKRFAKRGPWGQA